MIGGLNNNEAKGGFSSQNLPKNQFKIDSQNSKGRDFIWKYFI